MLGMTEVSSGNAARALVFQVDDGSFCIHLDWVEAVYPRSGTALHSLKGGRHKFLLHRGQPAWVLDLREAFGLGSVLGQAERPSFAVVRAGSALLALQVDACTGVRDLDLSNKVPVPSAILRDGGFPVGHLVELDGAPHVLLDPSRIPSNSLRDELDPLLQEALAFRDRQDKLAALTAELRRAPSVSGLKIYARLCRRNGMARSAAAARLVLKAAENAPGLNGGCSGSLGNDSLLRDMISIARAQQTGELRLRLSNGPATIYFDAGRIADAQVAGEWGKGALREILAARDGSYELVSTAQAVKPQRIDDAALWVLVEAIEQLTEERRVRHLR
jgi:chemotaxis signal transduction protein